MISMQSAQRPTSLGAIAGPLACRIRCRYHPASDMPVLPALAIGLPMRAWNALVTSTPALGTSAIQGPETLGKRL